MRTLYPQRILCSVLVSLLGGVSHCPKPQNMTPVAQNLAFSANALSPWWGFAGGPWLTKDLSKVWPKLHYAAMSTLWLDSAPWAIAIPMDYGAMDTREPLAPRKEINPSRFTVRKVSSIQEMNEVDAITNENYRVLYNRPEGPLYPEYSNSSRTTIFVAIDNKTGGVVGTLSLTRDRSRQGWRAPISKLVDFLKPSFPFEKEFSASFFADKRFRYRHIAALWRFEVRKDYQRNPTIAKALWEISNETAHQENIDSAFWISNPDKSRLYKRAGFESVAVKDSTSLFQENSTDKAPGAQLWFGTQDQFDRLLHRLEVANPIAVYRESQFLFRIRWSLQKFHLPKPLRLRRMQAAA